MALRIDGVIQGEEGAGPIDLEASLARLRAMLEALGELEHSRITVRLSPQLSASHGKAAPSLDA